MSKPFPAPQALAVALAGAAAVSLSAVVLAQEAPIRADRDYRVGDPAHRGRNRVAGDDVDAGRHCEDGATSATDLLQMLPAMQGYLTSSDSVNGASAGVTTGRVALAVSKYTLVLIDGQRVAGQALNAGSSIGGGFAVNLESIPLDAVERVEILDRRCLGAVRFRCGRRRDQLHPEEELDRGQRVFNWNAVQHAGGDSWSAGFTKGFGDLNTDHYNVLFNYSHDQQQTIMASQRPASRKGAFFPFTYKGVNYIFNQATSNTEPANITFQAVPNGSPSGTTPTRYSINPFFA